MKRRLTVSLAMLATLAVAGCGSATVTPGKTTQYVRFARLGVHTCRGHQGVQQLLFSAHTRDAAILCRDGKVVAAKLGY